MQTFSQTFKKSPDWFTDQFLIFKKSMFKGLISMWAEEGEGLFLVQKCIMIDLTIHRVAVTLMNRNWWSHKLNKFWFIEILNYYKLHLCWYLNFLSVLAVFLSWWSLKESSRQTVLPTGKGLKWLCESRDVCKISFWNVGGYYLILVLFIHFCWFESSFHTMKQSCHEVIFH